MVLFASILLLFAVVQNAASQETDFRSPRTGGSAEVSNVQLSHHNSNPDTLTYSAVKTQVSLLKIRLRHELGEKRIEMDSVKQIFNDRLTEQIFPYWYGTAWSFGGHSSVPKKGKIACGYFVSTTLRDMGLRVDRYTLAQMSPLDEAKTLSCGTEVTTVSNKNPDLAYGEIKGRIKKGIYFIGFDTGHVGFLIKRNDELFLVHSNYLYPVSVCIEPLKAAKVFRTFTKFHLVPISHNGKLIKKWLSDELVM